MGNINKENEAYTALKAVMDSYSPLSTRTWVALKGLCDIRAIGKNCILYPSGTLPESFAFVYTGLLRVFVTDVDGNEYNKNFFDEGTFPGSMAALLTSTPSQFTIESLEPSTVVIINFAGFRALLREADDLKLFHINYLEKNWLLEKDMREVEIVQENAAQRYKRFVEKHATMHARIPDYHIASHLGITPTHLSRIRKKAQLST